MGQLAAQLNEISIHALLAESDRNGICLAVRAGYFYPRSPCGERLAQIRYLKLKLGFLSTLSLRRATHPRARCALGRPIFLSTLSLRRATKRAVRGTIPLFLSTLSLRRATRIRQRDKLQDGNFYPRSPCGERQSIETFRTVKVNFYPRSPCGERLVHTLKFADLVLFLSTLSLRRATVSCQHLSSDFRDFYPRSPCGERRISFRTAL